MANINMFPGLCALRSGHLSHARRQADIQTSQDEGGMGRCTVAWIVALGSMAAACKCKDARHIPKSLLSAYLHAQMSR